MTSQKPQIVTARSIMCFKTKCLFLLVFIANMAFGAEGLSVDNAIPNVLILYDATGPSRWVGYIDSLFLANLIGHFQRNYIILPVEQYSKNRLNEFDTTFYLGTIYNNPLPHDFIQDVLTTKKDVVWFGHNLWQICSPLGKCDEKFLRIRFRYNSAAYVPRLVPVS